MCKLIFYCLYVFLLIIMSSNCIRCKIYIEFYKLYHTYMYIRVQVLYKLLLASWITQCIVYWTSWFQIFDILDLIHTLAWTNPIYNSCVIWNMWWTTKRCILISDILHLIWTLDIHLQIVLWSRQSQTGRETSQANN